MTTREMTAAAIIETLRLARHPEGGWYGETFRDADGGPRGHSTAIYYLLERGDRSHWHRVRDAAEVWHYYAGAPLELSIGEPDRPPSQVRLGSDIPAGERPQHVVPANWWQSAASLGDWTLVGCTVAPGFDFTVFEMAPPEWQPPDAHKGAQVNG
ncbi:cupin [Sinorhizobium medicae]|uniref:cupin domain-containing protein n=1 Tax=Sinorhizobium medicae TaxID=110321 RepID=UPI000401AD1B|nr:cupin domain-containing protein [Sinorhizobium medicae]MBO1943245.1 cupin domain-containing protein [Sinorhizobium medicae]MDX0429138.1 cupin [Sinorhizobium medicae]MDX0487870.1 cupin [Sinorhizobium medicae]MDX0490828.1 cupin [Sinorhizobium medicae]MDX0496838.1 cupin [Sinorhizobium medicae]